MNVLKMVLMVTLHIQLVVPRRRPQEGEDENSSAESFENLLYFQDCTKKKEPPTKAMSYSGPQIIVKEVAPTCQQCPAVCYSCCFNPPPPPVQNQNPFPGIGRSTGLNSPLNSPLNMGQNNAPGQIPGAIPGAITAAAPTNNIDTSLALNPWAQLRKSQVNPLASGPMLKKKKLKPFNALNSFRRSGNLKGLIEKDDDIKKILRDLVKVTMKKVDNIEKGRKNENDEEFPSSEVIVVQEGGEEAQATAANNNNGDENEE